MPDRHAAAAWYERVLGLRIVPEYEHWAENPRGPLMISSDGGSTKLALFTGTPQGSRDTVGYHLVAFRVDAGNFLRFLARLDGLALVDARGQRVGSGSAVDHAAAFSVYFCDPYGHRLELTTYDYQAVKAALG